MKIKNMVALSLMTTVLLLSGCGGGSGGDDDADASMDTAEDTTEMDPAPDVEPDVSEDGTDAMVEPDAPAGPCTPGDGTCTSPARCVGGACVDPVDDPEAYATDASSRPASFWWTIQLPALFTPAERCCFDFTGDGVDDDGFGALAGVMEPILDEVDVQDLFDSMIQDGDELLVNDWTMLADAGVDGEARFSVFETESTDTYVTMQEGDGTFLLKPDSFGTHGALVQFNHGQVADDVLYSGPSTFLLTIPMAVLWGASGSGELPLHEARIQAPIDIQSDGVHTVDETRTGDTPALVGGGKLGGVIEMADLLAVLDQQARACDCRGLDPASPVIQWEINTEESRLDVSCTDNVGVDEMCGPEDGTLCQTLNTICATLPMLGNIADVDRDGDGVNESLTAGFRFGWTGASIDGLGTP